MVQTPERLQPFNGTFQNGIAVLDVGTQLANMQLVITGVLLSAPSGTNRENIQVVAVASGGAETPLIDQWVPQSVLFNLRDSFGPIRCPPATLCRFRSQTALGLAWLVSGQFGYVTYPGPA